MFKMKSIIRSLLALMLVMSFASCASDNTCDSPMPNKEMKTYLQVKVTVMVVEIHERVGLVKMTSIILQRILLVERMEMEMM